ncbi:hypothetical protein D1AOALGA4SA_1169 [Olavius algarvensis Delta 1 endosymbiont]|nr:hypothetical protein D1AOALGA4SA_1169 [Olavius algarvensis Delta 1 endosymbiont]
MNPFIKGLAVYLYIYNNALFSENQMYLTGACSHINACFTRISSLKTV